MKRILLVAVLIATQVMVHAQRRIISYRPATRTTVINNVATNPTENAASDEVFYQRLKSPRMAIPAETHGHDHGPSTAIRRTTTTRMNTRTGAPRNLPNARNLWNNPSYTSGATPLVGERTNTRANFTRGSVCGAPIVESHLESVYGSIKPRIPMYLPYRHGDVTLWQGFYYNSGKRHGAIDYGRSSVGSGQDPTFGVYAAASGKVIDVGYSNGGGNFVKIEHTAPGGHKFRTTYLHLRNGFSNDVAKAKSAASSGKYKKYVYKYASDVLTWGTNSQKIKVSKGQYVKAGQMIAWAGNTGSGGIKMVLDDNGNIKTSYKNHKNVHLHYTTQVWDNKSRDWVSIDPYGVYNKAASINCYDLFNASPFARLWAPFYPSFHNVPLELVNDYWGYYTGMGYSLQTISIDRNSQGKLLASGSFQKGLSGGWYARFYMTASKYQSYFAQYANQGYRPRQMQVSKDAQGKPRFSVIWEKNKSGEAYAAFHNRDGNNFNSLWNTYVKSKKYHLAEHVTYTVNGKKYHAGVFLKKSNNGFYMYHGMSSGAFNQKFKDLYSKWQLNSFHVNGSSVGGVWVPKKQSYAAYYGMTTSDYQSKFNKFSAQGMRLHKIQSYNNSTRFAAIWVK